MKRPLLLIIAASVLWGTSGIFVHYMSPLGFSAFQLSTVRSFIAVICFLTHILLRNRGLFRISPASLLLALGSGAAVYGCGTFYYLSMQMTSVSTAVMLMYTAPVFVMAYSVLFMGERFTKTKLAALVAMIGGCALITGVIGGFRFNIAGILIGLLSGISYSAYNIFTKIQMRKKTDAVTASFYSFVFMLAISLIIAPPPDIIRITAADPARILFLMIAIGICTTVLPYLFYTLSVKRLPVGTAASLAVTEPLAATLFSIILFGEKLHLTSLCGILLILGAVFLLGKTSE